MQWPAMVATVAAAWFVGSRFKDRRCVGFSLFMLSNVLWVVWGWYSGAWALVVLQFCLVMMNARGLRTNAAVHSSLPVRP